MPSLLAPLDAVFAHLAELADDPLIGYRRLVIFVSWLRTAFEVYVMQRQSRTYDIPAPPAELDGHLSPETFTKAQAYGRNKMSYALLKTVYGQMVNYLLIRQLAYARLWAATAGLMRRCGLGEEWVTVHSLLWATALTLTSALPGLAWSYYFNFVLEARHGFNKSTPALWVSDQLKSWALAAAIGLPFLAGFLKVIEYAGDSFVPWLMLFMVVIQLTLQIVYPTFIQPLFNKFTPVADGEIRERVTALSARLGFPLKHLYVIDGSKRSSHSNAYFYGLPWSKQIVIYDTLIDKSTPGEVEAVLAHELGHWYFSHPTKLLLVAQAHVFVTLLAFSVFIHNRALFAAFGFDPALTSPGHNGSAQPIVIGFILYQLVFDPLDTFVQFGLNYLTRKFEYEADRFAVEQKQKPDLAAALIKLQVDNLASPHSDWLYSMYNHSHPTLPERLCAMEAADRRVRKAGKAE
ncbi:zinc metalloprotease [Cryptotrichosporon argae]